MLKTGIPGLHGEQLFDRASRKLYKPDIYERKSGRLTTLILALDELTARSVCGRGVVVHRPQGHVHLRKLLSLDSLHLNHPGAAALNVCRLALAH